MRYLLMICTDENSELALSPEESGERLAEYGAWGEEMGKRGILEGGARLRPTTDATTVRVRDGETLTSDGPFAETKEQVGGYFVVDCENLDDAIDVGVEAPRRAHRHDRGAADLGDVSTDVEAVVAESFRDEWGRVVATLIRVTGDWDLAEECAQDAFALALETWRPRRRPAQSRRVAHHDGPQPRDRSDPPRRDRRVEAPGGHRALVG